MSLYMYIAFGLSTLCFLTSQADCLGRSGCFNFVELFRRSRTNDDPNDLTQIEGDLLGNEYSELNHWLTHKTTSTEPDQNLLYIQELYKRDTDKKKPKARAKKVDAEKLFMALGLLKSKTTCNARGWHIIRHNHRALVKGQENLKLRRVDLIFVHYHKQHALLCRPIYSETVRHKLANMNKEKLDRVSAIADNLIYQIASDELGDKSISPVQRLLIFIKAHPILTPEYLHETLRHMVEGKPDIEFLYRQTDLKTNQNRLGKRFEHLFMHYLITPCKYYEQNLGMDVFDPATSELNYLPVDENDLQFYRSWARYRVCSTLVAKAKEKFLQTAEYALSLSRPKHYL